MSFEKFTDKARKVLVLAQDEARALHQPYVGTEHILLGLIQEKDGLAAQALERLGVAYDAVVKGIREVASIDEGADVSGHLSFTPRVKRVLENSLREAMQMGQSYISTEHLLLGIVRENEGTALDVLSRLGVKGDDIRTALNDLVGQSPVYAGRNPFEAAGTVPDSALKEFGTDLTQKARDGKLDPVIGRGALVFHGGLLVAQLGGTLEVLLGDGLVLIGADLAQLVVHLAQLVGQGHVADAHAGARLVHNVDGLVGQETILDIAVRQRDGGLKRLVGEMHLMMRLVAVAQPLHDAQGLLLVGLADRDGLETAPSRQPPTSRQAASRVLRAPHRQCRMWRWASAHPSCSRFPPRACCVTSSPGSRRIGCSSSRRASRSRS